MVRLLRPPQPFAEERTPTPPHYALRQHWHQPDRRFADRPVDVFYVHPTTYIKGKTWNQDLNDEHVNWRTRVLPIEYQASVFYEACNIFIPKYRQAVFPSFVDKKDNGNQALELAYKDVKAAFDYYWEHYNRGRPFFIAAHSQGTLHTKRLLKEIWADPTKRQQLIVAYVIGWPVEASYVTNTPHAAVCSTATDVGCLVSWNAQSPTATSSMHQALAIEEAVVCVNPLSWSLDTSYLASDQNRGALMVNHSTHEPELLLHYCGAQVRNGALEVTLASDSRRLQQPLGKGNYHLYDYSFFYQNIRDNIKERIFAYFEQSATLPAASATMGTQ